MQATSWPSVGSIGSVSKE